MTIARNGQARTVGSPTDYGEDALGCSPANFRRQPNTQAVEGQEATAVKDFAGSVSRRHIGNLNRPSVVVAELFEDDKSQGSPRSSVPQASRFYTVYRAGLVRLAGSSSDPAEPTTRPSLQLPSLAPSQDAKGYLSGDMTRIATGIEGIIRNVAQLTGADVEDISVTTRRFRGARHPEVKFTIHSHMNPAQAFAFWDAIGVRIDDWSSRLPARARRILNEQAAISVEWVE